MAKKIRELYQTRWNREASGSPPEFKDVSICNCVSRNEITQSYVFLCIQLLVLYNSRQNTLDSHQPSSQPETEWLEKWKENYWNGIHTTSATLQEKCQYHNYNFNITLVELTTMAMNTFGCQGLVRQSQAELINRVASFIIVY